MENSEIKAVMDQARSGIMASLEEIKGCQVAIEVLEERIKHLRVDIKSKENIIEGFGKKLTPNN